MAETKRGVVQVVAKTGGILFRGSEVWHNPTQEAKKLVTPDLKGKEVTLSVNEAGYFDDLRVTPQGGQLEAATSVSKPQVSRQDLIIVREVSAKVAGEVFNGCGSQEPQLAGLITGLAEKIERWILRP